MVLRRFLIIAIFSILLTGSSFGQPPVPTQPGGQPQNPAVDPDTVPLSGLEYLLIAGGLYGIRRYTGRKKD